MQGMHIVSRYELEWLVQAGMVLERARNDDEFSKIVREPGDVKKECSDIVDYELEKWRDDDWCPRCTSDLVVPVMDGAFFYCGNCGLIFMLDEHGDYVFKNEGRPL